MSFVTPSEIAFEQLRQQVNDLYFSAKRFRRPVIHQEGGYGFWLVSKGRLGGPFAVWYPDHDDGRIQQHFMDRCGCQLVELARTAKIDTSSGAALSVIEGSGVVLYDACA
jgi:hypothetical protein